MAFDIAGLALDFIAEYGLIAIFVLLVLDGALLLPVFPGELVLVLAVATYATDPSGLLMLIALSTVAGLCGALLLYGIIRGGGRPLVERFPGFFMMPRKRRERMEKLFAKPSGQSLVMFLRLLPLTRVIVSIPAGLAKMPVFRFLVLSTIGLTIYHAAFLWFAYEARRPGSEVSSQATMLREAYASPVWEAVQANSIITGTVVIVLGIIISVRASRSMINEPEDATGSLIGSLTNLALFWGGIALAAMTYLDIDTMNELILLGGLDMAQVVAFVGYPAREILYAVAGAAFLIGAALIQYARVGKAHKRSHKVMQKHVRKQREHDRKQRQKYFQGGEDTVQGRPRPAATSPSHAPPHSPSPPPHAPPRDAPGPAPSPQREPSKDPRFEQKRERPEESRRRDERDKDE